MGEKKFTISPLRTQRIFKFIPLRHQGAKIFYVKNEVGGQRTEDRRQGDGTSNTEQRMQNIIPAVLG